jgi:hypothetical protein
MPLFALVGHDGPRGRELRPLHRPAHLERLEPLSRAGRIRHAGPLLDEVGQPVGSVVVFEAESLAAARAFADGDPYVVHGVFARTELYETRAVF